MNHRKSLKLKGTRYKSVWELDVSKLLEELDIPVEYETDKIPYTIPESSHKYTPDFKLRKDVYIEAKGKFVAQDRKKILLLQEQYPNLKVYLLFQNANQKLRKGSKTSYGEWCSKNGIEWSHKTIKKEWLT